MVLLKLSRDSLMPFNATAPVITVRCFLLPALDNSEAFSADRLRLEELETVPVVVDVWERDVPVEEFRDWELSLGLGMALGPGIAIDAMPGRSDKGRLGGIGEDGIYVDEGGGIVGSSPEW